MDSSSKLKQRSNNQTDSSQPSPKPAPSTVKVRKPSSRSRAAADNLAWWKIVARICVTLLGLSVCLSYLITETAFWGRQGKWTNWRSYVPRKHRVFSQAELAGYNGGSPDMPLLLAIEGDVYDVTSGWGFYGPGSTYHQFVGRDASRAFATNCLSREDHLTHDIRGLTDRELAGIKGWHKLFENHQKYFKVGTVDLAPIDPAAPIPPPCDNAQAKPH
ncbi:cytochrome b5-like heme/steroid binding domain-containing protein [Kickxella alabastrina]|uniref:cytochrome b5-like heme/steroid binding domain-containing protein n=1 Tax=Kickxella alabastrina TaxID=61397 RepID=UPI00221FBB0D|nr:cytochrome b5-like heme/steroid binding domain-containing protein [Kickxella alabastrina]KAI7833347.1 cytochrome b5-like heme/steroid binding domain-containing protein [Kickxella alabastrina]KAJ1942281.1 hypothetical protein GGF37_003183 [Kickxella alabastrina]